MAWTSQGEAAVLEVPAPRKRRSGPPQPVRRLLMLPVVLLGVSVILFLATRVIPADPVAKVLGDSAPQDVKIRIRQSLGLDDSLWTQYFRWLSGLLHGDFGVSIQFRVPVLDLITQAFLYTLVLVLSAAVVTAIVALLLGVISGIFPGTIADAVCRFISLVAASFPPFFLAILAILVFGFKFGWFPISGTGDPPDLHHLILPALVLGLRDAGSTARLLRTTIIEISQQDYIQAAKARGIKGRLIIFKYILRNALLPAITDLGVSVADIIGSVILIETIFAWPGIGRLVFLGIYWNDFPLLTGGIMVLVAYAVIVNLAVDVTYSFIDPRIRRA